jgi:hypothetical protein
LPVKRPRVAADTAWVDSSVRVALCGGAAAAPVAVTLVTLSSPLLEAASVLGVVASVLGALVFQIAIGLRAVRARSRAPLLRPLLRTSAAFCAGVSFVTVIGFAAWFVARGGAPTSDWWVLGLVVPVWSTAAITGAVTGLVCATVARLRR